MKNILKISFFLFIGMLFTVTLSCNDEITFEDQVPDYTYSIIRSFDVNGQAATINHTNGVITATLPAGSNLSNVTVDMALPEGATVDPASGGAVDFSTGSVIFTITNNGVSRAYNCCCLWRPPDYDFFYW